MVKKYFQIITNSLPTNVRNQRIPYETLAAISNEYACLNMSANPQVTRNDAFDECIPTYSPYTDRPSCVPTVIAR